jgi:hypothetical protein
LYLAAGARRTIARDSFQRELNDGLAGHGKDNAAQSRDDPHQHAGAEHAALRVKPPLSEFQEFGKPAKGGRGARSLRIV